MIFKITIYNSSISDYNFLTLFANKVYLILPVDFKYFPMSYKSVLEFVKSIRNWLRLIKVVSSFYAFITISQMKYFSIVSC